MQWWGMYRKSLFLSYFFCGPKTAPLQIFLVKKQHVKENSVVFFFFLSEAILGQSQLVKPKTELFVLRLQFLINLQYYFGLVDHYTQNFSSLTKCSCMTNFGGVFPFNYLCNPASSTWWFIGFDHQPSSLVYIYLFPEENVATFMI